MNKIQQYVVGFLFDRDKDRVRSIETLLIEKTKPAWQKGMLNGVGGKIEVGETPVAAMAREFYEETGMAEGFDWNLCVVLTGKTFQVFFFVAAGSILGWKQTTEEKPTPVFVNHLPENTIYNLRWLIPLCLDNSIQFPVFIDDVSQDEADHKRT